MPFVKVYYPENKLKQRRAEKDKWM